MIRSLKLTFSSDKHPTLIRTEFRCPVFDVDTVCIRGGSAAPFPGAGTFKWTKAIKALSCLFLRSKLYYQFSDEYSPYISGGRGSDVISLSYAVSKGPAWVMEMFGTDSEGAALLRRLLKKYNDELRLAPETTLGINPAFLNSESIQIFFDKKDITTEAEIVGLLERLEGQSDSPSLASKIVIQQTDKTKNVNASTEFNSNDPKSKVAFEDLIQDWVEKEVQGSLFATEAFTNNAIVKQGNTYKSDRVLRYFLGDLAHKFDAFFQPLNTSERLALPLLDRAKSGLKIVPPLPTIHLHTTVAQVGTAAIFHYLGDILGLDVRINFSGAHTPALLRNLSSENLSNDIHLVTLALGATMTNFQKSSESLCPIMIAPGVSYRLISSLHGEGAHLSEIRGDMLIFKDIMSTSYYYYQCMKEFFALKHKRLIEKELEPDEIIHELYYNDERTNAILWFPHYRISQLVKQSKTLLSFHTTGSIKESFLFGIPSPTLTSDKLDMLRLYIRHAWIELRINSSLRHKICKRIVSNNSYLSYMMRVTGAHSFAPIIEKQLQNYPNERGTSCPNLIAS